MVGRLLRGYVCFLQHPLHPHPVPPLLTHTSNPYVDRFDLTEYDSRAVTKPCCCIIISFLRMLHDSQAVVKCNLKIVWHHSKHSGRAPFCARSLCASSKCWKRGLHRRALVHSAKLGDFSVLVPEEYRW